MDEIMTTEKSKLNTYCFLSLLLICGLFHFHTLFGGDTFVMEDASRFCYPLWYYGADIFQEGLVPLWNPNAAFGTPYLADPQMAGWYPPLRFFYFLLSPVNAFKYLILAHHLFAMIGFWFFARGRNYAGFSSLVGAIVFGFSMHSICLFGNPAILFSFSWIPWVFWLAERLLANAKENSLIFSFCLAMQLASGYPLVFYLTVLFVFFDLSFKGFEKRNQLSVYGFLKLLGKMIMALVLAVGFNLVWLIPFVEFRQLSNLGARLQVTQSLPFDFLSSFLNPFRARTVHMNTQVPFWISCFYVGLPSLVVIAWAVFRGKIQFSHLLIFLLALILSLGETAKLGEWFRHWVPFYGWVVRSGCLMPIVIFFMAGLTAECFGSFLNPASHNTDSIFIWFCVLIFGLALHEGVLVTFWPFWAGLVFLLMAGLDYFSLRVRWVCFLISMLFSLGPFDQMMRLPLDQSFYEKRPAVLSSMNQAGRIYQSPQIVNAFQVSPGKSIQESFDNLKENLMPNIPLNFNREEVSYENSLLLNSFLRWYLLSDNVESRPLEGLLSYWNVRYVMGRSAFADFKNKGISDLATRLDENPAPLPKWFSVSSAIPAGDWLSDSNKIRKAGFDFKNQCWIADSAVAGHYTIRSVSETLRTPELVVLEAKGNGKALLVSSETAYPGWRAKIDKGWGQVVEVNYGFRGVVLNEGEEKVSLVYWPTSFRLGCFISLLITVIWIFLMFNSLISKRQTNEFS
jgi:hypothetical protein